MTDRGTRVRWTTAALVAPTAAALFTGSTVWAAGHQPVTAAKPAAASPAVVKVVDPVIEALRAEIEKNTSKVDQLRATVAKLTARTAAIAGGSAAPSSSAARTSSTSSRSSSSSTSHTSNSSSSTKKTNTPRKTVHVTVPAPPPASNGSTGASGAVK